MAKLFRGVRAYPPRDRNEIAGPPPKRASFFAGRSTFILGTVKKLQRLTILHFDHRIDNPKRFLFLLMAWVMYRLQKHNFCSKCPARKKWHLVQTERFLYDLPEFSVGASPTGHAIGDKLLRELLLDL